MAEVKSNKLLERHEIADEFKWAIEEFYANDEVWEKDFEEIKILAEEFKKFQGKIKSKDTLLASLDLYEKINSLNMRVIVYAMMKQDEDSTISKYQGQLGRARGLYAEVGSELSFYIPELLQLSDEEINKFVEEESKLKKYEHLLKNVLRQREHVLSIEEEAIVAKTAEMAQGASNVFTMLNNADIKFPTIKDENGEEVEVTKGNFISFLEGGDRRVREDAFKALYSTYKGLENTIAATFTANLKKEKFYADVKKFPSTLAASLFEGNIPTTVYDNLINTIHDNLHLLHRYVALRKKALELEELHMYDLYTPMVQEMDIKFTYNEAKETVVKGLQPLGDEYVGILKSGFENRWVDVYESKGKRGGAYSSGADGSYPYILLNYKDTVDNMFTLAHEMGHSLHTYYTMENQPAIYSQYSIFVAEVASTVNESILMDYMIKNTTNPKEKMYYINQYLDQFKGTVFRQTMFAEFERITHSMVAEGKSLTAEELSKIYYELNEKYFGKDMVVDKEIETEWARIPHFYTNFYVYQYATGYSAAVALSKQILEEGQPAVERYINFLKKGDSDYPINVLKDAGVDMTSAEPIQMAMKVFEELLDEMEQMLG